MKFDAEKETNNIIKFIRDYYSQHGLGGAVVGLSGGKDSGVVLGLFVQALGRENVVALTLPCHSETKDRELAEKVASHFGAKVFNIDLTQTFDTFLKAVGGGFGKIDDKFLTNSNINLKPRLRMASLYYCSAMMSAIEGKTYLAAGTGNKSELYVGYFTKGGDGVCDISVLADFTTEEVVKLGEVVGVPPEVLYRAPTDGLSGKTDEENLGVSYDDISKVMNAEGGVSECVAQKIYKMHVASQHKFNIPTYRRK
jgi:NAD+ synthase